ncbi:hypothetical protein MP228_009867 [Amoeboaphelidium protococcarum]|nr:hypothetical protein MP228_009867 [Amoeboaphelidium protococcarum]
MKIIAAAFPFTKGSEYELSFGVGDQFRVVDATDEEWYEVESVYDASIYGMVPKSYFRILSSDIIEGAQNVANNKTSVKQQENPVSPSNDQTSVYSDSSSSSNNAPPPPLTADSYNNQHKHFNTNSAKDKIPVVINEVEAKVVQDFESYQQEELSCRCDEIVYVCAQSKDWYLVSKSSIQEDGVVDKRVIGLLPVSYATLTNANILHGEGYGVIKMSDGRRVRIPKVSEWKEIMMASHPQKKEKNKLMTASVLEYLKDDRGNYVVLEIKVQRTRKTHIVYRSYEDFYKLHQKLMKTFTLEAGQNDQSKRIIPYMPGNVEHVTRQVAKTRVKDFNHYLFNLLSLPKYISHSQLVLKFFKPNLNGDGGAQVSEFQDESVPTYQKSAKAPSKEDRLREIYTLPPAQTRKRRPSDNSSHSGDSSSQDQSFNDSKTIKNELRQKMQTMRLRKDPNVTQQTIDEYVENKERSLILVKVICGSELAEISVDRNVNIEVMREHIALVTNQTEIEYMTYENKTASNRVELLPLQTQADLDIAMRKASDDCIKVHC